MAATKVPHKQLDVYYDNMDPAQTDSSGLQWELMFIWCPINNPINPLAAKIFNLNFHPLEFVSRWRDPQLQVSENNSDLTK